MSKKNKDLSRLRREVEILKSQLKNRSGGGPASTSASLGGEALFKLKSEILKTATPQTDEMINLLSKNNNPEEILENNNPYLKKDLAKSASLSVFSFALIFLIQAFLDKTGLVYKLASPLLSRFGF